MFPQKLEPVNQTVDQETGEVVTWEHVTPKHGPAYHRKAYDQDAADLSRWSAQGTARRLLFGMEERSKRIRAPFSEIAVYSNIETRKLAYAFVRESYRLHDMYRDTYGEEGEVTGVLPVKKRAPKYRVMDCCRSRIGAQNPEIWYSNKAQRASYHKVGVCGSVWTCPICSRRINLGKQALIKSAYDLMIDQAKGDALMITFTIKHGIGDDLALLFDRLKGADREQMQKSYAYKEITRKSPRKRGGGGFGFLGYLGRISATEITYGQANGWHPHMHQLWFFDRKLTVYEIKRIRRQLWLEWEKACIAVGLPAPKEKAPDGRYLGVDVRRALSAAEYMAKFGNERQWAPEKEIASQHVKSAKGSGRMPFQLLDDYGRGDKQAGALFVQFAAATLGRHQLEFSKRLMQFLKDQGIENVDATDEELAALHDDEAQLLGELSDGDFIALREAERFGIEAYGTALFLAKTKGFDSAVSWLRSLPSYPSESSVYQNVYVLQRVRYLREKYEIFRELNPEVIRQSFLDDDVSILQYEHNPRELLKEWTRISEIVGTLNS